MRSFEVLQRTGDRWLLAGLFDDAAAAVADAKSLVERANVPIAVRVIAVEHQASGFTEWTIHQESTFTEGIVMDEPEKKRETPATASRGPALAEPQARAMPPKRRVLAPRARRSKVTKRPPRRPLLPARYAAALIVIAIVGGVVAVAMRQPPSPWVFDTPEAQKPHALRNSWTGEISR
jgi:hypothetical protein